MDEPIDEPMLEVHVVPGAKKSEVIIGADGSLRVRVSAPAADGKANRELIRVLAKYFGVRDRMVTIVRGEHSRTKYVRISR